MRIHWLLLISLLLIISCTTDQRKKSVRIEGNIRNFKGIVDLQEIQLDGVHTIDSVRAGNTGDFLFRVDLKDAGFYVLIFGENDKLVMELEAGENVVIRGESGIPANSFTVKGSPGTSALQDFYRQTAENREIADSLEVILKEMEGSDSAFLLGLSYDTIFKAILTSQREIEIDYIRLHLSSLSSLLVLYFSFGPEPVLTFARDSTWFLKLDTCLSNRYPRNVHVTAHHQRIMEFRREMKVKKK